jgi:hypothetical protein
MLSSPSHHTYAWQLATFCLSLMPVAALGAPVLGGKLERLAQSIR